MKQGLKKYLSQDYLLSIVPLESEVVHAGTSFVLDVRDSREIFHDSVKRIKNERSIILSNEEP